MNNIAAFVPKYSLDAANNLRDFIEHCKNELHTFGADLEWGSLHWKGPGVVFMNIDQTRQRSASAEPLRAPFIDFAKAYYRYRQTHRPANDASMVAAFRCLERALVTRHGRAEVADIDFATLDAAAQIARERFCISTAYGAGRELATIANFLGEKHLVVSRLVARQTR